MLFKPRTLALILALILSAVGAYGCSVYGTSGGSSGSSGFSATMNSALDDTVLGRIVMSDGDLKPEFSGYGSFSERHYMASTGGSKYAEVRALVSGDAQNYHYADNLGTADNVYAEQWLTADHASSIYVGLTQLKLQAMNKMDILYIRVLPHE